jgi:hypothetical protein
MNKEVWEAIQVLVGSDGVERIGAIARLLPKDSHYRENPELLGCHLLEKAICQVEAIVTLSLCTEDIALNVPKAITEVKQP